MIWVLIPKRRRKPPKIPIGRDERRCAFNLTTVAAMQELTGRALRGRTSLDASAGVQGRDGDILDQEARQYPEHAGPRCRKDI